MPASSSARTTRPRRLSAGQRLDLLLQAVTGNPAAASIHAAAPRRTRNVFKGAEVSRLYTWAMGPIHPDEELRGDLRLLRQRARRFERDNAWVRRYLGLQATNVLGPQNIRVEPMVRDRQGELDERVNEILRESWRKWCEGPVSADGTLDYLGLSTLALKSVPRDGEAFSRDLVGSDLNAHGYAIQLIDPDLVDETYSELHGRSGLETRLGIQVDGRGRRVGYWVSRDVRSGLMGGPRDLVPASEMAHHFLPLRTNQMRGVTWLSPVMATLDMLAGYGEAELVAARLAAAKMGFITEDRDAAPGESGLDEEDGAPTAGVGSTGVAGLTGDLTLEQLAQIAIPQNALDGTPGSLTELGLGKGFTPWDPQHPTTAFADATKMWLRETASGLEISYAAMTGDVSQGSFSSERVERQREQEHYQFLQGWWMGSWSRYYYLRWLKTAILTDALVLPSQDWRLFGAHELIAREWGYVKPLEDAQTAELQVALGINSRTRLTRGQYPKILEELKRETADAKLAGVAIAGLGKTPAPAAAAPADATPADGTPAGGEPAAGSASAGQ